MDRISWYLENSVDFEVILRGHWVCYHERPITDFVKTAPSSTRDLAPPHLGNVASEAETPINHI